MYSKDVFLIQGFLTYVFWMFEMLLLRDAFKKRKDKNEKEKRKRTE